MIDVRSVSKAYWTNKGPNVVLDDISFEIPTGKSLGILGRNGAGKSTLLRILGGAEMPDAGDVVSKGQISWPIGFSGGFSPSLTGEENCRFVARIYSQNIDEVVDGAREFADIGDYFYMPMRTFSSGMRARLAFGLSMTIEFETYLIDEVTAVGDATFRARCRAAFAARKDRSSLIMVSHSMETLREYCEIGAVLDNGAMFLSDDIEEAISHYKKLVAA